MNNHIKAFLDGPLLPKEVTQKEYDNVMTYLDSCGFIKVILRDVRQEERERAKKIIEELGKQRSGICDGWDTGCCDTWQNDKEEALKKLNNDPLA